MVVFAPHTTDPTKTTPRCLFQVLNDPMNSVFFILPFSKRPALLTQTSIEAQQVLQQASGYMAIEYIHLRTWIPNDVIDTPSIMLFLVIARPIWCVLEAVEIQKCETNSEEANGDLTLRRKFQINIGQEMIMAIRRHDHPLSNAKLMPRIYRNSMYSLLLRVAVLPAEALQNDDQITQNQQQLHQVCCLDMVVISANPSYKLPKSNLATINRFANWSSRTGGVGVLKSFWFSKSFVDILQNRIVRGFFWDSWRFGGHDPFPILNFYILLSPSLTQTTNMLLFFSYAKESTNMTIVWPTPIFSHSKISPYFRVVGKIKVLYGDATFWQVQHFFKPSRIHVLRIWKVSVNCKQLWRFN